MSLIFAGESIPCIHGLAKEMPPQIQTLRRFFWGLNGNTEKRGGYSGRPLEVMVCLRNGWDTYDAIDTYLRELDARISEFGDLEITVPQGVRIYSNCTFDGFERTMNAPLLDVANGIDGGYFIEGTLRFHQLLIETA